jgi:cysteine desulfurase
MAPIYLDYNATTPIDPAVVEAMLPFLGEPISGSLGEFGNPSSMHSYGRRCHDAVERARAQVAELLGAAAEEIIFTSGGTEASNHALKGAVFASIGGASKLAGHLITSAIEHPATLQPCAFLERLGCKVTRVQVDVNGQVDPRVLEQALQAAGTAIIVSIMHANNEVGTIQPVRALAEIAHAHGALMHTDAAQSVGKIPVDVNELGVDLLSVAGHKLYAPKGVGALYVRKGVRLEPLLHGAGHESGRRAGTENVPYVVALGMACARAGQNLGQAAQRLSQLRERLWQRLREGLAERVVLNGHPTEHLPNTLNVSFIGHVGSELLARVPEIAASTGSACHEGAVKLSPVLAAMKVAPDVGKGAIRLSVGRFTSDEDVDGAAALLIDAARGSAECSPQRLPTNRTPSPTIARTSRS